MHSGVRQTVIEEQPQLLFWVYKVDVVPKPV